MEMNRVPKDGRFTKGFTPWNKGKTGYKIHSEEPNLALKQKMLGNKFRLGQKKPVSEIIKRKNTFIKKYGSMMPIEMKNKIVVGLIGNKHCLGHKQTKEHIRKALRRRPKSSLEIKTENIFNELHLPVIYKKVDSDDIDEIAKAFVQEHKRKCYLAETYPNLKQSDIEILSQLVTEEEIKQYEKDRGN
jgi:hypothetical protein